MTAVFPLTLDICHERATQASPGVYTLAGAPTGYLRLRDGCANGLSKLWVVRSASGRKRMVVKATLAYGGSDTLTVVEVMASSSMSGSAPQLITFTTGTYFPETDTGGDEQLLIYRYTSVSDGNLPRSETRPEHIEAGGQWIKNGTGATARKLMYFDGTDDIEQATINETANIFADPEVAGSLVPRHYVGSRHAGAGHRLSLGSAGVPVTTADVTAATAIRIEPYEHNTIPILGSDGLWTPYTMDAASFSLSATYHLNGNNYDLYVEATTGTPRLCTAPTWGADTTRADALSRTAGRSVNNATITLRFGTGAGDTVSVPAGQALYLGTFRCTANGQTEDSAAKRFVWNMYNRVPRVMRNTLETANTWAYNGTTVRYANNNSANQLDMVRGLDEDAVVATALARWTNDTVGTIGYTLIGLDSSTAAAAGCLMAYNSMAVANSSAVSHATWTGLPGLGHRTVTWLERAGGGTHVWAGDAGQPTIDQSGINGWGMA
jgi:hypothetical protein